MLSKPIRMIINFLNLGALELLILLPLLLWLVLFIIAFVKCLTNPNLASTEKILWILAILFFPLMGSIAYLVVVKISPRRGDNYSVRN